MAHSGQSDLSKPCPRSYYGKPIQIGGEWDFPRRAPWPQILHCGPWGPPDDILRARVLKRKEHFFALTQNLAVGLSALYTARPF